MTYTFPNRLHDSTSPGSGVRAADFMRQNSSICFRSCTVVCLTALTLFLLVGTAWSCPNCKDGMAAQENAEGLVHGFGYSVLFMMAMPFLILSGLGTYMYLLVRKARRMQAGQKQAGRPASPRQPASLAADPRSNGSPVGA